MKQKKKMKIDTNQKWSGKMFFKIFNNLIQLKFNLNYLITF